MSFVEFLKSVGGVTIPNEVIQQAKRAGTKVEGLLNLSKLPNVRVLMSFAPTAAESQGNSRPLLAKDAAQAESDLEAIFGLSPSDARARIADLEEKGETEVTVTVDGALAPELFLYRPF